MANRLQNLLPLVTCLLAGIASADNIAVIGHPGLSKIDGVTIQKLYTGKIIELGGVSVTVINLGSGDPVRDRFLASFLGQDEEKYRAYWTVRRFIGKGIPPKELSSAAEVASYVRSHPGSIGYIDSADLTSGMNLLNRK